MIDAKAFGEELAAIVKAATAPLLARIEVLEKAAASEPQAGKDGRDGADGKDGTSVTLDDVLPALQEQVAKFLEAIPAPKDGRDGVDGKDGAPGEKGDPGRDGLDVRDMLRADGGRLIAVMSDGTTKDLGQFVGADGKDGAPGRDGKDGIGFEDVEFTADDQGRPLAKYQRGDVVKTVRLPCIVDRGVYKADDAYLRGDAVSFGGCLWIAQKDAPEGKPDGGDGWRLAVKKGRDGRDTEAKKVL